MVELAGEDHLKAAQRVVESDVLAGRAREDFGDVEGLGEELLHLTGAEDDELVVRGEFVEAQDRDDVLEVLVSLEEALHAASDAEVTVADDFGSERGRGGSERVDGRVDTQFGDAALEHDGRVKVSEGVGRSRVGQVVRRDVHGLEGRDRTLLGRGDAFLEVTHFGGEGRLVTHCGRRATEESGHFGTGLGEAEDVIDEEENVAVLFVAEEFGHRESREGDAHTGTGRLIHLAVHQGDLGLRKVLLVDDARFGHFVVEVIAFTGALADAGEDGETALLHRDVVDQLHDDDGLADASATEGADLTALDEGTDQIDDLDAGTEELGRGSLLGEGRGQTVDRVALRVLDRAAFVDGIAGDVKDAAEDTVADGHGDRGAGVEGVAAAHQAFGGSHRHGADESVAEVLLDLEDQLGGLSFDLIVDLDRVVDLRDLVGGELDVDDGAEDLGDRSFSAHDICRSGRGWKLLGGGAGGELQDFLGDRGLTSLVIFEGEGGADLLGVVGGSLHGDHARAELGSLRFQDGLVNGLLKEESGQLVENRGGGWLEEHVAFVVLDLWRRNAELGAELAGLGDETVGRQELQDARGLHHRVLKVSEEDFDRIDRAFGKGLDQVFGGGADFGEVCAVGDREVGEDFASGARNGLGALAANAHEDGVLLFSGEADQVAVERAGHALIGRDEEDAADLNLALREERVGEIADLGLGGVEDFAKELGVGTARTSGVLRTLHLRRRHELHGSGDLAGALNRFDSVTDLAESLRHVAWRCGGRGREPRA